MFFFGEALIITGEGFDRNELSEPHSSFCALHPPRHPSHCTPNKLNSSIGSDSFLPLNLFAYSRISDQSNPIDVVKPPLIIAFADTA